MTLKNKTTKTIALALATSIVATAALPTTAAQAHPRGYAHSHGGTVKIVKQPIVKKRVYVKSHRNHHGGGAALAAGIAGVAIGAIIADQVTRPKVTYVQPRPVYVAPRPVYVAPQPVYVAPQPVYRQPLPPAPTYDSGPRVVRYEDEVSASYEPWTPEWAEWCDSKYRSFNHSTGTFRGYDGRDHFCVVK